MVRGALGVAAAAAIAIGIVAAWPTDARTIRRVLADAADAVSVPAGESDLQRVARIAGLRKRLAADVVVEAGPEGPSIHGRDTVVGLASRLAVAGPATVSLRDLEITVAGGAGRATVRGIAVLRGGEGRELGNVDGADVRIELATVDGEWLIAHVTRVPDLQR